MVKIKEVIKVILDDLGYFLLMLLLACVGVYMIWYGFLK